MSVDWDTIILLILIPTGLISCIAIIISLIYLNYKSGEQIKSLILSLTHCSILLFMLCLVTNLLNFEIIADLPDITHVIWNNIAVLSWNFGHILVYILLMLRIYHTFHDTIYRVHKSVYITFVILLTLYILCCAAWIIQWLLYLRANYKSSTDVYELSLDIIYGYSIGIEIIDLVISIALITIFVRQMLRVAADLRDDLPQSYEVSLTSSAKSLIYQHRASKNLNINQSQILDAATKYSVLTFIATLSTQLSTLTYCVLLVVDKLYGSGDWELIFGSVAAIFFSLDCILNPICLFLLFAVNRKIYTKLCSKCHCLFGMCLKKMTQKRVKRKIIKQGSSSVIRMESYDELDDWKA